MLETALKPPICGDDIPHKTISNAIKPFIYLLLEKLTELNFRSKDKSKAVLLELFRHPAMDIKLLVDAVLEKIVKGPSPEQE